MIQSSSVGTDAVPRVPVHWEDAVIPKEWRMNSTYKRRHGYAPIIAGLDIETSQNDECAWMYLWTITLDNLLGSEGRELMVYGRTPEDMQHFLRRLSHALDLKTDYRLLMYIHNAKYDLFFLKHHICMIPVRKSDFIAKTKHQIIKCCLEGVYEVRDSAVYAEMPLWKMGAEVGLPKLEEDHDLIRTPETDLEDNDLAYCGRDSQILTRYYRKQVRIYGSIGAVPKTATGKDKYMISHAFGLTSKKYQKWILDRQLRITKPTPPDKETDASVKEYERKLERYQRDTLIMNRLRMAFFGGFCYASTLWGDTEISRDTGGGRGVISADLDACYASMMLTRRFPMDRWYPMPDEELPRTLDQIKQVKMQWGWYKNRAMLLHMRLRNIEARVKDFGFLPSWYRYHVKESGIETFRRSERVYKADELEIVLTDVDFRQLLKWYKCDIEMLDGLWSVYDYLPEYITDTVIMLYKDKSEYKAYIRPKKAEGTDTIEENIEYAYRKTMLARIYGVFCQDPIRMMYEWDEETHQIKAGGFEQPDTQIFSSVLYQWGVWTAALARDALLNMCAKIGVDNTGAWDYLLIYCDTDCIRWIDDGSDDKIKWIEGYNNLIRKKIGRIMCAKRQEDIRAKYQVYTDYDTLNGCGEWEIERYRSYKHIGIKMYAVVLESGRFKVTLAGLPSTQTHFDQYQTTAEKMAAFNATLYIDADHTGLLKTEYVERRVECDVVDYKGKPAHIVSMSSVRLVKADYRARPEKHADLLRDMSFEEFFLDCARMGITLRPARYGF